MIVVDTSVAVKWVVAEDRREEARIVLTSTTTLVAPDFMLLEAANALRKKVRRREMDVEQMIRGMDFIRQSVRLMPTADFATDAVGMSIELDHSPYDCCFLACARQHGLLISDDAVFLGKCRSSLYSADILPLADLGGEVAAALQKLSRYDQR